MIDFAGGIIYLGDDQISVKARVEDLSCLEEKGTVRKIQNGPPERVSFYAENILHGGMKFAVGIRYNGIRLEWIMLRWLEGPCTSRGWGSVTEVLLKDEYAKLSVFLEKQIGNVANKKRTGRAHGYFLGGK